MQDKGTEEGMGAKRTEMETVAIVSPWRETRQSFYVKVIIEAKPKNVKEQPYEGLG